MTGLMKIMNLHTQQESNTTYSANVVHQTGASDKGSAANEDIWRPAPKPVTWGSNTTSNAKRH